MDSKELSDSDLDVVSGGKGKRSAEDEIMEIYIPFWGLMKTIAKNQGPELILGGAPILD